MVKSLFLLFSAFICFETYARSYVADPELGCGYDTAIDRFIDSVISPSCLKLDNEEELCKCLQREKKTNLFVEDYFQATNLTQYQGEIIKRRTDQFWNQYKQFMHGAAIQKEILFNDELSKTNKDKLEKVVGCTPEEISGEVHDNIKKHSVKEKKLNDSKLQDLIANHKKCEAGGLPDVDCEALLAKIEFLQGGKDAKELEGRYCGFAKKANENAARLMEFKLVREWIMDNDPIHAVDRIKEFNCKLYEAEPELLNGISTFKLQECPTVESVLPVATTQSLSNINVSNGIAAFSIKDAVISKPFVGCVLGQESALTSFMKKFYSEKSEVEKKIVENDPARKKYQEGQRAALSEKSKCKSGDDLCNSFVEANKESLETVFNNLTPKENSCISYPEYLMNKSVPGDQYMKEIANTPDENLGRFFEIPKDVKTDAQKQQLKFLRSNPLLTKIAMEEKNKLVLGKALKAFAADYGNLSKGNKLNAYLKFMKGDVKSLMNNASFKKQQKYLCEQMVGQYSSILFTKDLPPPAGNKDLPLKNAVISCSIKMLNETSVVDKRSLEMRDLFNIPDDEEPEDEEADYRKMNEEYCKNYPAFKKSCTGDSEACRKEYLAQNGLKETIDAMDENNVAHQVDSSSYQRVASYTQEKYQDKAYKRWYKRKFGRRLKNPTVAYNGQFESVASDLQSDKDRISKFGNEAPARYVSNEFPATNENLSRKPASALNPGQIVPDYSSTNTAVFNPESLTQSKNATNAIANYDDLSSGEKINGLNQVKDYLSQNANQFEPEDIDEKNAEINEKIQEELAKQKAFSDKINKQISQNTSKFANPSFVPATGVLSGGSLNSSVQGSATGGSFGKVSSVSTESKASAARNDALVKLNEDRSKIAQTETIFSPNSTLVVKSGVVPSDEISGTPEISSELKVDLHQDFSLIVTNEKALQSFLKAQLAGTTIGEEKIIAIKDNSGESPIPQLIFRIKNVNGHFEIQSMPASVPVIRSRTLDNLNLNLKQFGKKAI